MFELGERNDADLETGELVLDAGQFGIGSPVGARSPVWSTKLVLGCGGQTPYPARLGKTGVEGVGTLGQVVADARRVNPANRPMDTTVPPSPSVAALRRSCSSALSLGRP